MSASNLFIAGICVTAATVLIMLHGLNNKLWVRLLWAGLALVTGSFMTGCAEAFATAKEYSSAGHPLSDPRFGHVRSGFILAAFLVSLAISSPGIGIAAAWKHMRVAKGAVSIGRCVRSIALILLGKRSARHLCSAIA